MIHVPCSQYANFSNLPRQQKEAIAQNYQEVREGNLDPHPSEFSHKLMAQFLLHYFLMAVQTIYKGKKMLKITILEI